VKREERTVETCSAIDGHKCTAWGDRIKCCWYCKYLNQCVKKWTENVHCRILHKDRWCSRVLAQWKRQMGEEKVVFT